MNETFVAQFGMESVEYCMGYVLGFMSFVAIFIGERS